MKTRQFFLSFFCLCLTIAIQAQNRTFERTISKADQMAIQQGEVDAFEYQLTRFTAAVQEEDVESANVMHQVLFQIIDVELQQAEKMTEKSRTATDRLEQQQEIADALRNWEFSSEEQNEEALRQFSDFAKLMKAEVEELKRQ